MVTDVRLSALVKRCGRTHAQAVWVCGARRHRPDRRDRPGTRHRRRIRVGGRVPARASGRRWAGSGQGLELRSEPGR
jgi:hypothetical protein